MSYYKKNFRMPKDIFSDSNINKYLLMHTYPRYLYFPHKQNPTTFYLHWFSIDLNKNSQLGFLWTLGNLKTQKLHSNLVYCGYVFFWAEESNGFHLIFKSFLFFSLFLHVENQCFEREHKTFCLEKKVLRENNFLCRGLSHLCPYQGTSCCPGTTS